MTEPSREIFGNIQIGWLVYILAVGLIALIVLAYRRRSREAAALTAASLSAS